MSVRVHIDRLVLDGFTFKAGESRRVQIAVERELARIIESDTAAERRVSEAGSATSSSARQRGFEPAAGAVASAPAGAFNPPKSTSPSQLGRHIAHSVYGSIRGTP